MAMFWDPYLRVYLGPLNFNIHPCPLCKLSHYMQVMGASMPSVLTK